MLIVGSFAGLLLACYLRTLAALAARLSSRRLRASEIAAALFLMSLGQGTYHFGKLATQLSASVSVAG